MNLSTELLKKQILNLNSVAIKVYQYILAEERTNSENHNEINSNTILLTLSDLLIIIETNYKKFGNSKLFHDFIPILHHTVQLTDLKYAINTSIKCFNQLYNNIQHDAEDITVLLQFVQQFLFSTSSENEQIRNIIFNNKIKFINVFSDEKTIRLQSLLCVEILVSKFNQIQYLDEIWTERLTSPYFDEIFSHLIDLYLNYNNIYISVEFWNLSLIYLHINRKFAIYWIHKAIESLILKGDSIQEFEIPKYFQWKHKNLQLIKSSWLNYLTILENLDGRQSHLILPSFLMLENITVPSLWKEFLICDMLKHTNTLVLKWSVNYVLKNFTSANFIDYSIFLRRFLENSSCDSLELIVKGFNNTFLYIKQNNNENINSVDFQNFINGSFNRFFKIFINIDWKSIPMHIIMKSINNCIKDIKIFNINELLLQLSSKIRRIENKSIRLSIRELYFDTFEKLLNRLNLNEYFKFLDTILNHNEILSEYEKLQILSYLSKRNKNEIAIISVDLLKILFRCGFDHNINFQLLQIFVNGNSDYGNMLKCLTIEYDIVNSLVNILYDRVETLNDINDKEKEFIKMFISLYNYNTNSRRYDYTTEINLIINNFNGVGKGNDINFSMLKENFIDRLLHLDFNGRSSFIIDNVSMLLDKGGHNTLYWVVNEYALVILKCDRDNINSFKMSPEILNRIILEVKNYIKQFGYEHSEKIVGCLVDYIINLPPEEIYEHFTKLLDIDPTNIKLHFHIYQLLCFDEAIFHDNDSEATTKGFEQLYFQRSFIFLKEFYSTENGFDFLLRGLTFGEPLLGERRAEYEYIVHNNLQNDQTSFDVRLINLKLMGLIKTFYKDDNCQHNMKDFRNYLLEKSENLNNKKSRYFKDSKQHRLKLRTIQSLAILSRMENGWDDRLLIPILKENNQNDITCIIQLIVASTIENESTIINLLTNASEYSPSALVSIFIIAFLYSRRKIDKLKKRFAKTIINLILPWTLGQNFNVRLQAQITIYHLIEKYDLKNNFQYLFDTIEKSFHQGNIIENMKKLNDFRYSKNFKPEQYLEYYTIFTLIPKIMNVALDEWFINFAKLESDRNWDRIYFYEPIKCKIKCEHLKKYYDETIEIETDVIEEILQIENIQRKINPMNISASNVRIFYDDYLEAKKNCDIIVVASLVDKSANLGGICRTCEVLGIKNVYLSSLKYTETKEFKGLSMTAEKWLNINDLKPQNIKEFLIQKKLEGYKIIGAEQTSNSVNFIDFKFPKKSILLLGNEKEGIPANLIAFVDSVVEIPQFGVVRSLNVHVTAALFLWEYCKQHLSK